jgi:glyoxylase-like metal-dependent hydrolase (beta-lactamase superfamily II)
MALTSLRRAAGEKISFDPEDSVFREPEVTEVAPGYYAITNSFENIGFVVTEDGIVVIDSGISEVRGEALLAAIRTVSNKPIRYLIYTHGHVDHVKGAPAFRQAGATVIAQRNVSRRFRRYTALSGYHARINGIQGGGNLDEKAILGGQRYWSTFPYPDIEYIDEYDFSLGGKTFHLHHEYGETDDATLVEIAEDGIFYTGDLVVSSFPNIGNPNKVIRYDHEWAEALDRIAAKNPKILIPGHGAPLHGDDALTALHDTSEALRIVYQDTVRYINEGRDLDYILEHVTLPERLVKSPYLAQTYGNLEFTIRGIHRRYTGWYDGNPTHLNPAPRTEVDRVVFDLISDRSKILDTAREKADAGDLRLALHVVDLALGGDPDDAEALSLKESLLRKLGSESDNLFYVNFYLHEADVLKQHLASPSIVGK